MRIKAFEARNMANTFGFPLGADFHALDSDSVRRILLAADSVKYRAPKTANGSRARYLYAYLNRAIA